MHEGVRNAVFRTKKFALFDVTLGKDSYIRTPLSLYAPPFKPSGWALTQNIR